MSAETGLHFDYRRDGRATGRLLVTDEGGRTILLDQVNLDAERKRTEIAEALRERVPGLQEQAILSKLSQLALDVPPETPRSDHSEVQGQSLALSDPEPWPEPVEGVDVLDELEATFSRFLMLPEGAATTCALWVMHAHAHDAFEISPLLAITSPEKRCGKTTLLELATALVPRPMPAASVTPAVLFRAVEKYRPTLLADELDTFIGRNEELRGILNSGHRRSLARVIRTVGDDFEPRSFATWCPKILALIGRLPDTLDDRSIPVPMRRKRKGERVERLRLDRLGELEPTRRRAWSWAQANRDVLRSADPTVPPELNDRAADNWRPLLVIADLAGGRWPDRARLAAVLLSSDREDDNSAAVLLLGDLKRLYEDHEVDRLSSAAIVAALVEMEDRPWPEWRKGEKPMSAVSVSRLVKPFGIGPKQIRVGERTCKGYRREDLEDAWNRYLPARDPEVDAKHPKHCPNHAEDPESSTRNTGDDVSGYEGGQNPHGSADVSGVSAREGGLGEDYEADERIGMQEEAS
jgi:putative DNA primase/helicase